MTAPIVLVVESHDREQALLPQILRRFDFDSHVVPTGDVALHALQEHQYVAVLIDLQLSEMTAFEFARAVRNSEEGSSRRIPLIGVAPGSDEKNLTDCQAAGMDDCLNKPCSIDSFRRVLLRYAYDAGKPNLKTLRPIPPEEAELDVFVGESVGS